MNVLFITYFTSTKFSLLDGAACNYTSLLLEGLALTNLSVLTLRCKYDSVIWHSGESNFEEGCFSQNISPSGRVQHKNAPMPT
jgi:hypothetical protein